MGGGSKEKVLRSVMDRILMPRRAPRKSALDDSSESSLRWASRLALFTPINEPLLGRYHGSPTTAGGGIFREHLL